jgi:dihydropteroate synthase
VIKAIIGKYPDIPISIDTLHAKTAARAIEAGASLLNDISGGKYDPEIVAVAAQHNVPYICMHMRGTPKDMVDRNQYDDMIRELFIYFKDRINHLRAKGVRDIIIDPGFGFAKNIKQNFQLMHHLHQFQFFDVPVLVGISRKSFIYKTLNIEAQAALNGTTVMHTLSLLEGAQFLRVHDVREAKEAIQLVERMREAGNDAP